MSVIFKTVKRPSDPRVENSPKRYYPQLITLGRSVDLKFIAQKIQDRSSLSVGDIKSERAVAGRQSGKYRGIGCIYVGCQIERLRKTRGHHC